MKQSQKWSVISRLLTLGAAAGIWSGAIACSGAGDVANVAAGASAMLADTKSSVSIPTGGFDADVTVAITENKADVSGVGSVEVLSIPLTVEFSQARIVKSDEAIDVKLQLDPEKMRKAIAEGKGIYAKVRVKGEQISFDRGADEDSLWFPTLGVVDSENATLTIKLYASADEVEVVGVAGNELKVIAIDPALRASKSAKAKKKARKAVNTVGMGANPWAVVCNTDALSDHGVVTCNGSNANSMVAKVQDGMTLASYDLRDRLNMDKLVIQQLTAASLGQTNLSSLPDPAVLRKYDPSVKYNMVYLTKGKTSHFTTATGVMVIDETQADNPAYTQIAGSVFHHELVHAVQSAVCGNCASVDDAVNLNRNSPLSEGTAAATGMLAAVNWDKGAVRGKTIGRPRNWGVSLAQFNPYADSYLMTEFFTLANNGDLTYLMPLFHSFNGSAQGVFNKRLDVAIGVALGKNLPDVFLKRVMPARNVSSPNGAHYQRIDVTNNDIDHSVATSLPSMASHQYLFSDTSEGDVCINVNLFQGADPNLALVMLNGTEGGEALSLENDVTARMTTVGDVLTVQGHTADVQVINLSTGGVADSKGYTIAAYTDGHCLDPLPPAACNPMKVMCDEHGCGLYVQAPDGRCWARAASCDAQGRCTRQGFEGGFNFGNCENLRNQMTQNIPVGEAVRENPANLPEDRNCGDVQLGCQWMVLCPR